VSPEGEALWADSKIFLQKLMEKELTGIGSFHVVGSLSDGGKLG
jgi:hypothetical protein